MRRQSRQHDGTLPIFARARTQEEEKAKNNSGMTQSLGSPSSTLTLATPTVATPAVLTVKVHFMSALVTELLIQAIVTTNGVFQMDDLGHVSLKCI